MKTLSLKDIIIEPTNSFRKLELYKHENNKGKKASKRLRGGRYETAKIIISIFIKQIDRQSKIEDIKPNDLPPLRTNNMNLVAINNMVETDRSICNHINFLIEYGFITKKINHGRHHNYELYINPEIFHFGRNLNEIELAKEVRSIRQEKTKKLKEEKIPFLHQKKNFQPSFVSRNNSNNTNSVLISGELQKEFILSKSMNGLNLKQDARNERKIFDSNLKPNFESESLNNNNSAAPVETKHQGGAAQNINIEIVYKYAEKLINIAITLLWNTLFFTPEKRIEFINMLVNGYFLDAVERHRMTGYGIDTYGKWFEFYENMIIRHSVYFNKEKDRAAPLPHIYFSKKKEFSVNNKELPRFIHCFKFELNSRKRKDFLRKQRITDRAVYDYFKNLSYADGNPKKISRVTMVNRVTKRVNQLDDPQLMAELLTKTNLIHQINQ